MNIDVSKYVMTPGQGEVITLGPPNAGKITILVDPKNTGETRFCMFIQVLDPGAVVPVHLHEREEQILFFYRAMARPPWTIRKWRSVRGRRSTRPDRCGTASPTRARSPCMSWRRLAHRGQRMSSGK